MSDASRDRATVEMAEIARMGRLAHNWDGHGADAVPVSAQEKATWFMQSVDSKFGSLVPRPTVGAIAGGIALVWRVPVRAGARTAGEREIEMIFHARGNEWSVSDRDGIEQTLAGENVDLDVLLKIIDRYIVA